MAERIDYRVALYDKPKLIMPPTYVIAVLAILHMAFVAHPTDRAALDDIVGTWQIDTIGGTSARSVCAPSPIGSAVVCEQRISTPTGVRGSVNLFMVDSAANRYVYYGINEVGAPIRATELTISNHIWTYGGRLKGADGRFSRTVNDFSARTFYVWRVQTSSDGDTWTTVRQGKATRR